jgi:hypothetical protein
MVATTPNRRVHRRVAVGLPLLVRGTDATGMRFEDTAESYDVSRTGASFLTSRELRLGSEVEVVIPQVGGVRNPASDFATLARVMRVTLVNSQGLKTVGVEFLGARFRRVYVSEETR